MIIVLNFGSQFAHLIARRVRDLEVRAEIVSFDTPIEEILKLKTKGIILSGGPASVLEKGSPKPVIEIFKMGIPILGICYGHQVMAHTLGGKISRGKNREFGKETISIKGKSKIFSGLNKAEEVWFSHGDYVKNLPKDFINIASTKSCSCAGFENKSKNFFGIQFHPEVTHTKNGNKILENFLFDVCKAKKDWKIKSVEENIISDLKHKIKNDHVLIGISGGVDSLVAATILHKTIGNRLHALFVDTGLLRKGEKESVMKQLKSQGVGHLHVCDASKIFLKNLGGVTDPEKKRKIIAHTFIDVFSGYIKKELKKFPIKYFAQGTIYPDRVESAKAHKGASKIKSHHNLTIPKSFGFEIVEPLRDLYKDEVRKVGIDLGIPKELIWRHPFPGPGLGIRIIGELNKERLEILREADNVFVEELKKSGEYEKIWQAFAVLLPLKTVGVMGDARTYEYIISLRAVNSVDGMSADWHKMPHDLLENISNKIVRNVKGVNRVLYDVSQKPPATIEYE